MGEALRVHDAIVRSTIERHGGYVIGVRGISRDENHKTGNVGRRWARCLFEADAARMNPRRALAPYGTSGLGHSSGDEVSGSR